LGYAAIATAISVSACSAVSAFEGAQHSEYMPSAQEQVGLTRRQSSFVEGAAQADEGTVVSAPVAAPQAVPPVQRTLANPAVEWIPIPAWMAGTWAKRGDTTTYACDLRTGVQSRPNEFVENEMTVTWGHRQAPDGSVWHANLVPNERDGFSDGKEVRFVCVDFACPKSDAREVVTQARYVVTETYGRGNEVADMFQQESINQYTQVAQDKLENNSSNRVFSTAGKPVRDGKLVSEFRKVGPFRPTATLNGIDLASAFKRFLEMRAAAGR
jgi:hypothetical protein